MHRIMYLILFCYFIICCKIVNLCRTFQYVQTSDSFQSSVDTFPSTFHGIINLAHAVFGTAALSVDKALGTCCDRADSTGQIQITFTALVTFVL